VPEPVREPVTVGAGGGRRPAGRHASGQQAIRQQEIARAADSDQRLARMGYLKALLVGSTQTLALLAGISRDGVVMADGMFTGLSVRTPPASRFCSRPRSSSRPAR